MDDFQGMVEIPREKKTEIYKNVLYGAQADMEGPKKKKKKE